MVMWLIIMLARHIVTIGSNITCVQQSAIIAENIFLTIMLQVIIQLMFGITKDKMKTVVINGAVVIATY